MWNEDDPRVRVFQSLNDTSFDTIKFLETWQELLTASTPIAVMIFNVLHHGPFGITLACGSFSIVYILTKGIAMNKRLKHRFRFVSIARNHIENFPDSISYFKFLEQKAKEYDIEFHVNFASKWVASIK